MLGFHRPEKTRGAGSVKSADQAKGGVGLTFKFVILLATILCPSAGLVGIGRYRLAITYLASLMAFVSLFILLRLIYHPAAVVLLLILTFSVHVFSLLHSFRLVVSAHLLQLSLIKAVSSLVLGLLFLLMLLVIIYEKKNLLGLDVYRIYSYSMHPTLQERDWIIADSRMRNHALVNGDIVFFRDPEGGKKILVKRIVGVSGDTVRFTSSDVAIADKVSLGQRNFGLNNAIATIGPNEVFVVGDNVRSSRDSRHFGGVSIESILARAVWRVRKTEPFLDFVLLAGSSGSAP